MVKGFGKEKPGIWLAQRQKYAAGDKNSVVWLVLSKLELPQTVDWFAFRIIFTTLTTFGNYFKSEKKEEIFDLVLFIVFHRRLSILGKGENVSLQGLSLNN